MSMLTTAIAATSFSGFDGSAKIVIWSFSVTKLLYFYINLIELKKILKAIIGSDLSRDRLINNYRKAIIDKSIFYIPSLSLSCSLIYFFFLIETFFFSWSMWIILVHLLVANQHSLIFFSQRQTRLVTYVAGHLFIYWTP